MLIIVMIGLFHIHTVEVADSIPAPPTMNIKGIPGYAVPFFKGRCLKN
jgi:hypothetical protein